MRIPSLDPDCPHCASTDDRTNSICETCGCVLCSACARKHPPKGHDIHPFSDYDPARIGTIRASASDLSSVEKVKKLLTILQGYSPASSDCSEFAAVMQDLALNGSRAVSEALEELKKETSETWTAPRIAREIRLAAVIRGYSVLRDLVQPGLELEKRLAEVQAEKFEVAEERARLNSIYYGMKKEFETQITAVKEANARVQEEKDRLLKEAGKELESCNIAVERYKNELKETRLIAQDTASKQKSRLEWEARKQQDELAEKRKYAESELRRLKEEGDRLLEENQLLADQKVRPHADITELNAVKMGLKTENAEAADDLGVIQGKCKEQENGLRIVEENIRTLREEADKLKETEESLERAKEKLKRTENKVTAEKQELGTLRTQREALQEEVMELQAVAGLNAEAFVAKEKLKATAKKLKSTVDGLENRLINAREGWETFRKRKEEEQVKINDGISAATIQLEGTVDGLTKEINDSKRRLKELKGEIMRNGDAHKNMDQYLKTQSTELQKVLAELAEANKSLSQTQAEEKRVGRLAEDQKKSARDTENELNKFLKNYEIKYKEEKIDVEALTEQYEKRKATYEKIIDQLEVQCKHYKKEEYDTAVKKREALKESQLKDHAPGDC